MTGGKCETRDGNLSLRASRVRVEGQMKVPVYRRHWSVHLSQPNASGGGRGMEPALRRRGQPSRSLPDSVDASPPPTSPMRPRWRRRSAAVHLDAVVDWIAFTPDQIERDIPVSSATGTRQYIFISSATLITSGGSLPHHQNRRRSKNPYWQYWRDNTRWKDRLMREHRPPDFRSPWSRPSLSYGDTRMVSAANGWARSPTPRRGPQCATARS